ncbi:heterodimeric geranylgeranyl pyrophosphate synthase small subunit, chloroplastic [Nicotiana attenuata]|uniref:Heterodimeric geranylgeranyl pyrophosphate synthase small subunit, chloroplastic n=2 Tax=Nicotiana attenuata TaxID=49451 RepID=A0A314KJT1_NICAT|nr:heterodimeric geranylgeranyl pyrophosphate synthase small subunit, chloroplastic [Nicotiana attenuata]
MARVFSSINGSANLPTLVRCSFSSCYKPMVVKMGRDQSYWASIESEIEAHLKKVISIRPPESVFEPMHYLTFTTPKSTAPALCVAACELVGGERAQAMAAASAIHLMHVATYTHQHMHGFGPKPGPAIDHKFGPNIELLTGDGIMSFAIVLLAKAMSPARENSDKILRVITEVTRAVGSQGLLEGQFRAIEWSQSGNGDEEMLEYVCKKKEGEIHACGAACGAILGDGSDEEVESLRNYGLYVGTIQGMINGVGRNNKNKRMEELRILAMKELQIRFKGKKVSPIASLIEESFVPPSQCDLL